MNLAGKNHRHYIDVTMAIPIHCFSAEKSKFRQEKERRIYNIQSIHVKKNMTKTGWHGYNIHDTFKLTFCRDRNKYSIIVITDNSLVIEVLIQFTVFY